jgi:integrase
MANDDFYDDGADNFSKGNKRPKSKNPRYTGYPGIVDQRWKPDGTKSSYNGNRPYFLMRHYTDDNGGSYPKRASFSKLKDAVDTGVAWDLAHQNRHNPGYLERERAKGQKEISISTLVFSYANAKRPNKTTSLEHSAAHHVVLCWIGEQNVWQTKQVDWHRFLKELKGKPYQLKNWKNPKETDGVTVARYKQIYRAAYEWARKSTDGVFQCMYGMENPLDGIRLEDTTSHRTRILLPDEEIEVLLDMLKNCLGTNKYYGPLGMFLGMQCAFRSEEAVGLDWADFNFLTRRLRIRKSKTDKIQRKYGGNPGRTIVIPPDIFIYLRDLYHSINDRHCTPNGIPLPLSVAKPKDNPHTPILLNLKGKRMKPNALSEIFSDAVTRARIQADELGQKPTYHDLRRNARMDWIGPLDELECEIMIGHVQKNIAATYKDDVKEPHLKKIQDKLDKAVFWIPQTTKDGEIIRDRWGDAVREYMSLLDYASVKAGRRVRVTNEELFYKNIGLHPYLTRRDKAFGKALAKQFSEDKQRTLATAKCYVVRRLMFNGQMELKPIGYMTFGEAVETTKLEGVQIANLLNIEHSTTGLSANNHWFFSDTLLTKILPKSNGAIADKLNSITLTDLLSEMRSQGLKFINREGYGDDNLDYAA